MIMRWNDIDRMFGAMDLFRSRMNRMLNDYDRWQGFVPEWQGTDVPKTNLYDLGEKFEIRAEVPGLAREDLNIKVQGNYLEISGTRKTDAPEGYTAHRLERGAVSFSRSFTLPADVNTDKVEATLKNGILTLVLPKSEAAKPKQITVH